MKRDKSCFVALFDFSSRFDRPTRNLILSVPSFVRDLSSDRPEILGVFHYDIIIMHNKSTSDIPMNRAWHLYMYGNTCNLTTPTTNTASTFYVSQSVRNTSNAIRHRDTIELVDELR